MGLKSRSAANLQALETPLLDPSDETTQPSVTSPSLPPGLTPRSDRQESHCESFFAESLAECLQAAETDDEDGLGVKHIDYYQWDWTLWALTTAATILTGGMLLLGFRWMPIFALRCRHRKTIAQFATCALVHCSDGTKTVVQIFPGSHLQSDDSDDDLPRFFTFRHLRYFEVNNSFVPLSFQARQPYTSLLKHAAKGLARSDVNYRLAIFGLNLADVPVKPHLQLLLDEVLHPFYVFQIWSVVVWYLEPYILYATAIAIISVFSALVSLFSTRRNLLNIRKMAHFECPVRVHRRRGADAHISEVETISSKDLVPGDVIEIDDQMTFPCDIITCSGSVVVNESMLTGESLPVLKASLPLHTNHVYCPDKDKRFTLWAGTKALEARPLGKSKVLGVVFRTGFMTTKGRLVRSILFPKPSNFKFYEDSIKFVAVLSVMAISGFLWSVKAFNKYGVDLRDVILNACDIVTIAVPPALPAALTIGTEFALERLKQLKIFCISPNRVNVSGQLDTLCFDKTGTLTEDGVDVMGVLPAAQGGIETLTEVCNAPQRFLQCLACCHSITDVDGQMIGDPLDLKMFDATGWVLKEPSSGDKEDSWMPTMVFPPNSEVQEDDGEIPDGGLAVVRRFDFTSNHQRMSVIARTDNQKGCHVFLKGAPEVVRDLCDQNTIPSDFLKVVQSYTKEGLRLLACAHKYEKSMGWHHAQRMTRERAETGLTFVGILILENRLKPETAGVIEDLKRACIECCMITGDHALTGVAVSKKCGLIDSNKPVYMAEISTVHAPHPTPMTNIKSASFLEACNSPTTKGAGFQRSQSEREISSEVEAEEEDDEDESGIELHGIHSRTGEHAHFEEAVHDLDRRDSVAASMSAVKSVVGMEQKMLSFHLLDEDHSGPLNLSLETLVEVLGAKDTAHDFEIAINGPSFEYLHKLAKQGDPEPLYLIMERAKVFARMSPEQKQLLIELFSEEHERIVGMCGDGANDCGALKAAHVGLSLSDAEASIAAPFTSSITNITPLLNLMREGRAALVTSISCFKFMALYSTIQFITVLRLYQINSNMSDFQYLWIDLFIIFPLAVYMARTGPYHKLSKQRPHGRLISFPVLTSVLGQTLISGAFQAFAAWWTLQMKDFKCDDTCPVAGGICDPSQKHMDDCCAFIPLGCTTKPILSDTDDNEKSVEASSAFLFSQFQYLAVVIAFNTSKPFRRSIVTNGLFFSSFVALSICSTVLLLAPDPIIQELNHFIKSLEMERFPTHKFKWKLGALAIVNAIVTYAFECVVEWISKKKMRLKEAISLSVGALMVLLSASLGPCILLPVLRYT